MKAVTNRYENFEGENGQVLSVTQRKKIGFPPSSYRKLQFLGKTSIITHLFLQDTMKIFHYNRHCIFMQLYCPCRRK